LACNDATNELASARKHCIALSSFLKLVVNQSSLRAILANPLLQDDFAIQILFGAGSTSDTIATSRSWAMIDGYDIFVFVIFAVMLKTTVIFVVLLGSLPRYIAHKRGHRQATAVNVASWLGLATLELLWPFALIWAFWDSSSFGGENQPVPIPGPGKSNDLSGVHARLDQLEAEVHGLQAGKEKRV
jgi:hypothetical protein